jgi:hypothetical protein
VPTPARIVVAAFEPPPSFCAPAPLAEPADSARAPLELARAPLELARLALDLVLDPLVPLRDFERLLDAREEPLDGDLRWLEPLDGDLRWLEALEDDLRWLEPLDDDLRCLEPLDDDLRWFFAGVVLDDERVLA